MYTIQECWTAVDQTGYYGRIFDEKQRAEEVHVEDPNFKVTKCYRIVSESGKSVNGIRDVYFDVSDAREVLENLQNATY